VDAPRVCLGLTPLLALALAACRGATLPAAPLPPALPTTSTAPLPTGLGPLRFPVPGGTIVGTFGWTTRAGQPVFDPYLRIRPPDGSADAVAVTGGTVAAAHEDPAEAGLYVVVDHAGGWSSLYGECGAILVKVGGVVPAGAPVCSAERSAPFAFGLLFAGQPVNPRPYLVGE
jgi:murein DD-endopeptidase MepM/ murein hydrolase activator NlpD